MRLLCGCLAKLVPRCAAVLLSSSVRGCCLFVAHVLAVFVQIGTMENFAPGNGAGMAAGLGLVSSAIAADCFALVSLHSAPGSSFARLRRLYRCPAVSRCLPSSAAWVADASFGLSAPPFVVCLLFRAEPRGLSGARDQRSNRLCRHCPVSWLLRTVVRCDCRRSLPASLDWPG